jgi:hypothetical protein
MRTGIGAASWIYSFSWAFTLSLVLFPVCRAVLVNRTIDSSYGDPLTNFIPQYHPPNAWSNQTCTTCPIQSPPGEPAFNGTWMATQTLPYQNVNFTLEFTGMSYSALGCDRSLPSSFLHRYRHLCFLHSSQSYIN